MSPLGRGDARVAIIGAASPLGTQIREELARCRIAGERVNLYGSEAGAEMVLSEYDGEARMIQEPDVNEILGHDVVFLCETGKVVQSIVEEQDPEALVIDVAGGGVGDRPAPLLHSAEQAETLGEECNLLQVPHPLSAVLAEVLAPSEQALGVERASAVVLRPASDFGEEGVEELRDQTVRLLNFADAPKEVFGRQLVFNVVPQQLFDREGHVERRIGEELSRTFGWDRPRFGLQLVTVPVFYGHSIALNLVPAAETNPAALAALLGERSELDVALDEGVATPVEVTGDRRTSVAGIRPDRLGGFHLWLVAGEASRAAAAQAIAAAGRLRDL